MNKIEEMPTPQKPWKRVPAMGCRSAHIGAWCFGMPLRHVAALIAAVGAAAAWPARVVSDEETPPPDSDVVMTALVAELERSMVDLVLEDLPRPYFIQYRVEDRKGFNIRAGNGGLLGSDEDRSRVVTSRVRVGSYQLDNTNLGGGVGQRPLPIDDDETAIRQSIWLATDADYKQAIETLTRKRAILKQKNIVDRPDDFSPAKPVQAVQPPAALELDRETWEDNTKRLSARFKEFPPVQLSGVFMFAGVVDEWIVNSEGTRLRTADRGMYIDIRGELQAEDGMRLTDSLSYVGLEVTDIPSLESILTDIDKMCRKLIALSEAPILEHYAGPVLFEPLAAGMVFEALLADGLCARPTPLGSGGWGDDSLEKKIGLRILPRSFTVVDDPRPQRLEGAVLAGSYTYDDEAVAPQRVSLVEKGVLKTLLAGRAPTKKIKHTTGHGRGAAFGDPEAMVGCLYVSDDKAVSAEQLKQSLIDAAGEEGLPFGLRIESMEDSGYGSLGDPICAYKVYVDDGREELVRGLEFLPVETRSLKQILAAGTKRKVHNAMSGVPASIIAPAILFEELELTKIEEEFDKPPYLKPPAQREP